MHTVLLQSTFDAVDMVKKKLRLGKDFLACQLFSMESIS